MSLLPANVGTGHVTGIFVNSDGQAETGKAWLRPRFTSAKITTADPPTTVLPTPRSVQIGEDGRMAETEVVATSDPDLGLEAWTYEVTFKFDSGVTYGPFDIAVPEGETVDLTLVAPAATANGVQIIRGYGVPDLADAAPGDVVTYDPDENRTAWWSPTDTITASLSTELANPESPLRSSIDEAAGRVADEALESRLSRIERTRHAPALGLHFPEAEGGDIQGAIDRAGPGGHTFIGSGTHQITAPLRLTQSGQRLTIAPDAILQVPAGYTDDVIRIGGTQSTRGIVVTGDGTITEEGKSGGATTEPGSWTAIRLQAIAGVGVTANRIEGLQIQWAGTAVAYEAQGNGWVNGNQVQSLRVLYARTLIDTTTPSGVVGYASNTVKDLMAQSGKHTEYGIKNLTGRGWTFQDVSPWDLGHNPTAISAEIAAGAKDIRIIGGLLTVQNFTNHAGSEVVTLDRDQTRPWTQPEFIGPDNISARTDFATQPVKIVQSSWPAWSLPGSAGSSGVTFMWRSPSQVANVTVSLALLSLNNDQPNTARFQVYMQAGSPNSSQFSRTFLGTTPAAEGDTTYTETSSSMNITPDTIYRIAITRTAGHAEDTYAGSVGVVGVLITPTT